MSYLKQLINGMNHATKLPSELQHRDIESLPRLVLQSQLQAHRTADAFLNAEMSINNTDI